MTTPWTPPTVTPLADAQDAQSGQPYNGSESQLSSPSGIPV